ncbi:MAG: FAD-dependent oxidoreductase, partial [Oscillospiraceae bacterium]|nr:FAD-dependent oxidoreductase [Oscillospiraceae bacterium]
DAVVMGRALLADPYLPRKAFEGCDDEIVRCCRCFTCMGEKLTTGLRICALNPVIGHEYEHNFAPPPAKLKKVLIAGGGPGGMQCALTAAERGHDVMLCEKTASLGGALKANRGIPLKSDMYKFIEVKTMQMKKAGVEVRLNTEVTPEFVGEIAPDALIIAAGSVPFIPSIPGIEKSVTVDDLPDMRGKFGKRVIIIGGGLAGCETAVHLAIEGHEVTVVEMKNELCAEANPRYRPLLLAELKKSVKCMTQTRAVRVTDDGLVCETQNGETLIPADTVVCAAGRTANTAAMEALVDCAMYVDTIGGCSGPANVKQAVFRGHFAAIDI